MRRLVPLALLLLCTGCVSFDVRTLVGADGSLRRRVRVEAESPLVAERLRARFGPAWRVRALEGSLGFEAEREGAPSPNPTKADVAVRRRLFFTDYEYREDLRDAPRAVRVSGPPLWLGVLADDTSLELFYRVAAQRIRLHLEVELPGRPVAGDWHGRSASGAFLWDADVRALPEIHVHTRVLHPLPILLSAAPLGLFALACARRFRPFKETP